MNNMRFYLHIGALLEEDNDRNFMRITKRQLRDSLNVFETSEKDFKQMFRLDKVSVMGLIEEIGPHYQNTGSIPLHLKVLTTLNFVATGSFQNPVGSSCWISLSQPSVSRIIHEITSLISQHLLPEWVQFPTDFETKNNIKQGFYNKWNVRGVLGVVDGTHVEILAPPTNDVHHPPFVYINRKGKHSINVMLISDSNTKIIACNARYPGSVHDSAIWQMSNIKTYLKREYDNGDKSTHLLGDSGYPLEPWLFTPFSNFEQGSPEERFNNQFKTARNVIERTNGILKGRFRCLSRHRVLLYHPSRAANIIYSCCVLHNIALRARIPLPEEEIEYRDEIGIEGNLEYNDVLQEGRATRARYIRNNLLL
ncbi:putative nuclease HARBI1 [Photinus pyralis]|nr:putative nuclease HARBI1 [Photinus pyralis]XP_031329016.1 putative nuclease HARBI1 [Photinus pyralis]XP_031329610.1 putative nuclease HARBI1 [Photinus pyralis]XP_031338213.1 putative nuclease HARBI1 [Photinus pyralis]XP_031339282.1 putative nuclease HARBI1 [Photinus pyralis]XP_031349011.1 putative nuclease HARBI1 [Photinus pyralis]XP_031351593.1 putative nuclease HARBI1 [Photinus pyralis]